MPICALPIAGASYTCCWIPHLRVCDQMCTAGRRAMGPAPNCVTIAVHSSSASRNMERKTDTLNLRVTPELKELIRLAAEREHRTIANFIEVLVRQHCVEHDVAVSTKRPQSR
ncbi:DUF1778 domain-containing protein [Caballeronia sp. NK8]|uniref:type II toxin -antitoxin system TacA 1-like antitoxin n=1 Tax=Caballeronia sp. NK8 TaxID=140098 RepID=UPI003464241B